MKYIGNYESWIKQEWIDYMKRPDTGYFSPRDYSDEKINEPGIKKLFTDTEWDRNGVFAISYEKENFPFNIELPIDFSGYDSEWWFMKFTCGLGQPIHQDMPMDDKYTEVKRFWMALQDYELGHLFIYDSDKILTGYKRGDIYQYEDLDMWHTGGNLGNHTRLTFNMTVYK